MHDIANQKHLGANRVRTEGYRLAKAKWSTFNRVKSISNELSILFTSTHILVRFALWAQAPMLLYLH